MTSRALLILLVVLAALALPSSAMADDAGTCDVVASVHGSDASPGTADAPVRTVRGVFARLQPGDTGCLTAGETFHELVNVNPSGTATAPLSLRSTPGGRAAFTGQIRVNGSHIRIAGIDFLGLAQVAEFAPKTYHLGVDGDDVVLSDLEITSPRGTCVDVGQINASTGEPGPRADGFVLERSRVHGCGLDNVLTRQDSGVHGVYLKHTLGARIRDSFVHDNRNRGIQLWPAAHGTLIDRVVLDRNGSNLNIGSHVPQALYSRDTTVRGSVIADSRLASCASCDVPPGDTQNVVGYFPAGSPDYGNHITDNCIHQGDAGRNFGGYGFRQTGNRFAAPSYADRAAGDLHATPDSSCGGYGTDAEVPEPRRGAGASGGGTSGEDTPPAGDPPSDGAPGDVAPGDGAPGDGDVLTDPSLSEAGTVGEELVDADFLPGDGEPGARAATRRGSAVITALESVRRGLRVRVRTSGPGRLRLRLRLAGSGRALAARTVRVPSRTATVLLRPRGLRRLGRARVRLDVWFTGRGGARGSARLRTTLGR